MGEYGEAMYQKLFEEGRSIGRHISAIMISTNMIGMRLGTLEEIFEVSGLQLEEVKEMAEKLCFDERGRVIGGNYKIAEFASDLIRRRRFTLEDIAVLLELPLEEVKELAASIEMNDTDGTNNTTE